MRKIDPPIGAQKLHAETHLTVSAIYGRLPSGHAIEDPVADYPDIPQDAFAAAFIYGKTHPQVGRPVASASRRRSAAILPKRVSMTRSVRATAAVARARSRRLRGRDRRRPHRPSLAFGRDEAGDEDVFNIAGRGRLLTKESGSAVPSMKKVPTLPP